MNNFLLAIAIYFSLPFAIGSLAAFFGLIVDGLALVIHGAPPTKPPAPPSGTWTERYMPIQLRHIS